MKKDIKKIVRSSCLILSMLLIVTAHGAVAYNPESNTDVVGVANQIYLADSEDIANGTLQVVFAQSNLPDLEVSPFPLDRETNWSYNLVGGVDAESLGLKGDGVRIAVIDSGVDVNNVNLTGAHICEGYDYIERKPGGQTDSLGHGTYVSQILVGNGDLGVMGIAQNAELVPLRCFSETKGSVSEIVAAIYDAVDKYQCDIINMSWGITADYLSLKEAVEYAFNSGVILVSAVGNVNQNEMQGTSYYPATYPEVIGVGAIDQSLTVSDSSQHTNAVFICAPGVDIAVASLSGMLSAQSGSSFAVPYITAELALIKQLNPAINGETAFSLLREKSTDLGDNGYDTSYGYGVTYINNLVGNNLCSIEKSENLWKLTGLVKNENEDYAISTVYDTGDVEVKLPYANVSFEAFVIQELFEQANENTMHLVVDALDENSLNVAQKQAVEELNTVLMVDTYLISNGIKMCMETHDNFDDGIAKIALPYEIKNNLSVANYCVFSLSDDGKLQKINTKYNTVNEEFVFKANHFSKYLLVYNEKNHFELSLVIVIVLIFVAFITFLCNNPFKKRKPKK